MGRKSDYLPAARGMTGLQRAAYAQPWADYGCVSELQRNQTRRMNGGFFVGLSLNK